MADRRSLLIAALLAACASSARAQTLDVRGDTCLDEPALRSALARFTRGTASGDAGELSVEVRGEGDEAALRVRRAELVIVERRFDWRVEDGVRPVSCEARVRAVALALALALENARREVEAAVSAGPASGGSGSTASGSATTGASATAGAAAKDPEPAATEPARPSAAPERVNEEEARAAAEADAAEGSLEGDDGASLRLELGAGILLGVLPEPALLGLLGAELEVAPRLSVSVAALGTLPTESPLLDGEVEAHALGGRAALCVAYGLGTLSARVCPGVLGGVVRAQGSGFAVRDEHADLVWLALLSAAALDIPLFEGFSLRASVHVGLPLLRAELRVRTPGGNTAVAHTAAPINASASLALLWALR